MSKSKPVVDLDVEAVIADMATRLKQFLKANKRSKPLIVGVHTGGVWVAHALHEALGLGEAVGELNIAFYRDDFSRIGMHPTVSPSNLPVAVEDRHLVLVDDILYSGRTVRAAMNEIFDYGRPASITLAVLIDREERDLPIRADIVGSTMQLAAGEHVKLTGPQPMKLELSKVGA